MGMARTKAGRPRKSGAVARHKCGKIIAADRHHEPSPTDTARTQRLARGATNADWQDQRHGSALGRLWLSHAISEAQYMAGQDFATMAARFHSRSGAGRPTPPAADLERVRGLAGLDQDPIEWRRLQIAYTAAHRAIPHPCLNAVWALVILDEPEIGTARVALASEGLRSLARHFG